jgi:predicted nucleic acid-binding protein
VNRFVLDASVALSWCFPEENSKTAEAAINNFAAGAHAFVTAFWRHEVLNALLHSERRNRISAALTAQFLSELSGVPITADASDSGRVVFGEVKALSRKHRLTAYDAAYLELAIREKCALATLDEELVKAAKSEGVSLI